MREKRRRSNHLYTLVSSTKNPIGRSIKKETGLPYPNYTKKIDGTN